MLLVMGWGGGHGRKGLWVGRRKVGTKEKGVGMGEKRDGVSVSGVGYCFLWWGRG